MTRWISTQRFKVTHVDRGALWIIFHRADDPTAFGGMDGDIIVGMAGDGWLDNDHAEKIIARINTMQQEYAAMRAVTGPPCPKCGHFLFAEHNRERVTLGRDRGLQDGFRGCVAQHPDARTDCRITFADIIANHPEIAAEMGLV